MIKFLRQLNSGLNLFHSLLKKSKSTAKFLKQKKLLTAAIAAAVLAASYFSYQQLRPQSISEQYELASVKRQNIKKQVTASGSIKSQTEVNLKFQSSGRLTWVGVKQGDRVKQWQAIASLDQRALQKKLIKALRDYAKQRHDFEEDRQVTYQDTVLTDSIKRILEKNQWDLDKAVLDVELKDIALQYAVLISPIDGLVTHIDVPVAGVNITPANAVFTVVDPDNLQFEAEVDETEIGFLTNGQPAAITLDAYPDEVFPAQVDSIDFSATTDSSGSTVFLVKFNLLNSSNKFRLGMNGEVTITVAEKQNVLVVPAAAISDENNLVQIIKEGKIVPQVVKTGLITDELVEISSGLEENQTIIVGHKTN